MGIRNLNRILHPRSVAVIGASERPNSAGAAIMRNLLRGGFRGRVIPVHPCHKIVNGMTVYKSIRHVDETVDLAAIAAPIDRVPRIVEDCVRSGAGGAVIMSGVGRQKRSVGSELTAKIRRAAGDAGFRIIGPDSQGVINTRIHLNAGLSAHMPRPGAMAFVSQSGAIGSAVIDLSLRERFGFGYFISTGISLDVDCGDLIDYLGNATHVGGILLYVEHLQHIRNFMSAARAVSRVKPIIALKAGRGRGTPLVGDSSGREAILHQDDVYDAAFMRAGVTRVRTFEELFDCADLLARNRPPSGPHILIITNAGGAGAIATDALTDRGAAPAVLDSDIRDRLNRFLPGDWSRDNPVDIGGDADAERFRRTAEICMESSRLDGLLILMAPTAFMDLARAARTLADLFVERHLRVFASLMGGIGVKDARRHFNRSGIACFDSPERAIHAFMNLYEYGRSLALLQEIPPRLPVLDDFNREAAERLLPDPDESSVAELTKPQTMALLSACGIPVAPDAAPGPPVAQQLPFSMGIRTDRDFGPVILFGLGGFPANVLNNRAMGLPPLNRLLARRLIENTRGVKALRMFSLRFDEDLARLEEMLIRLSRMAVDFPEIRFLEIDPFVLDREGMRVEDARTTVGRPAVGKYRHLVISPYPNHHESRIITRNGLELFVRPIRPEDAPLFEALFDTLSPQSVYFRFFNQVKRPDHKMLARFTQVDYDRQIALTAIYEKDGTETMIGVARVVSDLTPETAEFAVLVGDPWHGHGVGAALLQRCIDIARERGVRKIWGSVLARNTQMLALGKKLGFIIRRVPGEREFELTLEFGRESGAGDDESLVLRTETG